MRPARHVQLLNKAVDAATAAIEVYNKPAFSYREEAFSILMLNAWELLLKARVLKENGGSMRAIEVWEGVRKKDGTPSTLRHRPKVNRAGNNLTIGLQAAANLVREYPTLGIDASVVSNIELLTEIRDNAVHLHNKGKGLQKRVQEVGSAALRNFAQAASLWFGRDLTNQNFAIMPVAFETPQGVMRTAFRDEITDAASKLLKYISDAQAAQPFDPARAFNVSIQVDVKFARTISPDSVIVVNGPPLPGTIPITLTEEQVLASFPWTYSDVQTALTTRYSDCVFNSKFNTFMRELEKDPKLCKVRFLDPKRTRGSKKKFYSANILSHFDAIYRRKADVVSSGPQSASVLNQESLNGRTAA